MAPFDLPSFRRHATQVARDHDLVLVVLHGSHTSGRVHPGSDVDVAVRKATGLLSFTELLEVTAALQKGTSQTVDLVDLARADPLLAKKIFERAELLFERKGAFFEERLRTFHRYEDYRPYLRIEATAVKRALEEHAD